ncbi:hypothetical protein FRC07_010768 [Ceratobasidium sp. 392]|nr:hypothetical protein FRC07_010768 [Ceratobasidium sp. 392]
MNSSMSANAKGKQRMVELPPIYAKAVAAATGSTMTALTNPTPDAADSDNGSTDTIPAAAFTSQIFPLVWSRIGML